MLKKLPDGKNFLEKQATSWPNFAIRTCDVDVYETTYLQNILESLVPSLGRVL
jgi:hypothetical protein